MTIVRYWDRSFSERAALTESEVAELCNIELMHAGVLRPDPLVLLPEDGPPLAKNTYFVIEVPRGNYGDRDTIRLAFANYNDASDALKLAEMQIIDEYGSVRHAAPLVDARVVSVALPTLREVAEHKAALTKQNANREANDAAKKRHKEQCQAVDKALAGVWDDYRQQQAHEQRLEFVRKTWLQYLEMTGGNEKVARAFLAKAFPPEWSEARGEHVDLVAEAIGSNVASA